MQTDYKKGKIKDIDCLVSQRLKKRRLMLGIDLKEIADLTGRNIATIQGCKKHSDYTIPSLKLGRTFKLLLNYFFKNLLK